VQILVRAALAALCLTAAGCPEMAADAVPTTCARVGDKCKLPSGPLGVCQQTDCAPGAGTACFVCQPQH